MPSQISPPQLRISVTAEGMHLVSVALPAEQHKSGTTASRLELWASFIPGHRPDTTLSWDWMKPVGTGETTLDPSTVRGLHPPRQGDAVAYRARWVYFGVPLSGWSAVVAVPAPAPPVGRPG